MSERRPNNPDGCSFYLKGWVPDKILQTQIDESVLTENENIDVEIDN